MAYLLFVYRYLKICRRNRIGNFVGVSDFESVILLVGHFSTVIDTSHLQPVRRAYVKKEYLDWNKIWIHYEPLHYTDVRAAPERKVGEIKWHRNAEGDERRSYEGRYEIRNQLPLIPCGRTGR